MKNLFFKRLEYLVVIISLAVLSPVGIFAQVRVSKITGPEMLNGRKGIIYTLPRTGIRVDLWISKTQQIPGPLAEFAEDYLGLDEVITKSMVNYTIEKSAISTSTEPDPGQVYLIEKEEKASGEIWISFGKTTPLLTLEKFDKTISPPGYTSWNDGLFNVADAGGLYKKYTESLTREIIDTITRRVSIDTLVMEEKIFKRSMVEFTDKEKAQEAADKIRQIEQDKYNLLVGYQETSYSREAIEFMYDKLEELRLEYLKLFTGVSIKETIKFNYRFFPDLTKEDQLYSLAAFSASSGITSPDEENDVAIRLQTDVEIARPVDPSGGQPNNTGLVYRLPQSVTAVLSLQGKEIDSKRVEVLQLGAVYALPQEFKRVEFDPETGALKSVIIE